MSDYYPYMEQHTHRAEEWAAQAAEGRLAAEVVRKRRTEAKAVRLAARTAGRPVRRPVIGRLRSLWSS